MSAPAPRRSTERRAILALLGQLAAGRRRAAVLAAAAGNAAYQTLTRAQAQADWPAVQVLWSGLVGATIMTAMAPLWWSASAWPETPPTAFDRAVFGDVPDAVALVGMAMIAASPQVARPGGIRRAARAT